MTSTILLFLSGIRMRRVYYISPLDVRNVNGVTLLVKANDKDGNSQESHLSFRMQPVNFPFQFRFYDFNSSDKLAPGAVITLLPFLPPLIVSQQIETMKVYRKAGFSAEELTTTDGSRHVIQHVILVQ